MVGMVCPGIPLLVTRGAARTPHAGGSAYIGTHLSWYAQAQWHVLQVDRTQKFEAMAGPKVCRTKRRQVVSLMCVHGSIQMDKPSPMRNMCQVCCTTVCRHLHALCYEADSPPSAT